MIDVNDYEGACGDVDENQFGPIFIMRRKSGDDVVKARAGLRDRTYEISDVEVLDPRLTQDDVVALVVLVYLLHFTDDYYREKADRVSLAWKDGSKTVTFNYPAPRTN
jgi:hypothetical protein